MKIHFLRNATLIIRTKSETILVDPMLAGRGELPPFSVLRHKKRRNPLVDLPEGADRALEGVTSCLITHCKRGHADHLDKKGIDFLRKNGIPTFCRSADESHLRKKGVRAVGLSGDTRQPFLRGKITLIPARHGHGWVSALMGPGVGYVIELPGEPSVYIAGDTVLTKDVRTALQHHQPDVAIVAAGNASVDVGDPILMSLDEVMEFTSLAPRWVVANHLEALNHCSVTREQVSDAAKFREVYDKLQIPSDGELLEFRP